MDFSAGPWPWIVLAIGMTALLPWFTLGLVRQGFAFYRLELCDAGPTEQEDLRADLQAIESRLLALERSRDSIAPELPVQRLRQRTNGSR